MKKTIIYIAIAFGFLLSNCEKANDDTLDDTLDNNTIIIDNSLYANAPDDEFDFADVQIINDSIHLTIRYGGGCGEVEFKLIDSEAIMESYPVQRNIRLSLKDEDTCEALITEELSFDLTPIKVTGSTIISINLTGWEDALIYEY
jgi:protein involved in sex pheromone biosynthesis